MQYASVAGRLMKHAPGVKDTIAQRKSKAGQGMKAIAPTDAAKSLAGPMKPRRPSVPGSTMNKGGLISGRMSTKKAKPRLASMRR